ncbi:MAG: hypothetical protein R3C24_04740 [Cyanobacteriota/Melainabacteria group bacterium]|nr:hypothetical protein [Candidatus Obscuribacterales bacterium]
MNRMKQALKRLLTRDYQGAPITDWLDLYAGALFLGFVGLMILSLAGFFLLPAEAVVASLLTAFSCFCMGLWCSYLSEWANDAPDHDALKAGGAILSSVFFIVCVFIGVPESWTSFCLPTRDILVWCIITVGILVAQWPDASPE